MAEEMTAAEFKNKCLRIMDRISKTGRELLVTKRGKPVVRILPARTADAAEDMEGLILHQDGDLFSTGEKWEAEQ